MVKLETVSAAVDEMWEAWRLEDAKRVEQVLHESVTGIGTGVDEIRGSLKEMMDQFYRDFDELTDEKRLEHDWRRHREYGDTAIAEGAVTVMFKDDGYDITLPVRYTFFLLKTGGRWLISHTHLSMPAYGQDEGTSFPIEALKARQRELENTIAEQQVNLEKERKRTEELLLNTLPAAVVKELKETGAAQPRRFEDVSIMFTDFVGFTNAVATVPTKKLVQELHDIYSAFDDIMVKHQIEKIQTIGDSYLAVSGLPQEHDLHAIHAVRAAKDILAYLKQRNSEHGIKWRVRIGIHAGPVITGVIGKRKYSYNLFGDSVNIASRLESSGEVDRINVSAYTYELIKDEFDCEYRGKVDAKGKGEIDMYFVK